MASDLFARIVLQLQDNASRGLESARKHIDGIGQDIDRVKHLAAEFLGVFALKSGAENIVRLSDQFANLSAKIKLATSSEQEYNAAQSELFNIAQRSRTALDTVVALYAKVQIGVKNLGGTQKQTFDTTEAITRAFKISGASASESAGGIQQLTQSLASGVLRGEEFNSIMENGSRVAQALADGLGVPVAALRGMAEQGELTADRVISALLSQKEKLAAEYATLPQTVSGAWQQLENQFLKYIGTSNDVSGANRGIADSIAYVADHLDGLIQGAVKAGEVLIGVFAANKLKGLALFGQGLVAARTELRATAAAAVTAATSVARAADATARGVAAGATAAATAIAGGATVAESAIAAATAAGTAAAASARIQGASVAESIAIAGMAAGKSAMAAGATQAAAAKAAFNATKQAALEAGATEVQAATAAKAAQRAFNAEVRLTAGAFSEAALAAQAAAARTAASVEAASRRSALALDLVNKALFLPMAAMAAWDVGKWALQFEWVQQASANAGEKIAKIVAFMKAMTAPFSSQSWAEFGAEIERINEHFGDVRAKIDGIDKAPPPTAFNKIKQSADSMAEGIDAALAKTQDAAKRHADAMIKPYDDAAKAIIAAFDAEAVQIDKDLKDRLYAIDYLATSEEQKIAATTQAVIDAEFKKTTAVLNTKAELDKTWNETYGRAIELARKAGGDITALEQQGAEARIGSLQSVVNAYQSSVDSMISEEYRLLDAVRHTAEERENLSRSVEDKIRALQQKGMSDVQAYADQQKQIDEKQAAAKKALLEGNFTDAKKYAEEAIRLAESTAHAVDNVSKDGQGKTQRKEAISENQAVAQSIAQIKESAALADSALSGLGNAQLTQAQNVAKSLDGAKSGLADFKGELDRTIASVNQSAQIKISIDANAAKIEMDKLDALASAKELSVKIKADPINADAEIAALKATLEASDIKVPAAVSFSKVRGEELEKLQNELNVGMAFLQSVPVNVSTEHALQTLEGFKADIDSKLSAQTEAAHFVNPDFGAIYAAIDGIKQSTFSTHTIYVNKVENNATGGLIQHLATGGRVAAKTFRRVIGAISGPGTGTSDDVPVMASNGEFVVKTDAVQYYGVNFMNALNNKQLPVAPGYAIGGAVGQVDTAAQSRAPDPQMDTVNLVFTFASKAIPVQTSRSLARDLAVELRSLARAS